MDKEYIAISKLINRLYTDKYNALAAWEVGYVAYNTLVGKEVSIHLLFDSEKQKDESDISAADNILKVEDKFRTILKYLNYNKVYFKHYYTSDIDVADFMAMFENVTTLS